MSWSRQSQHDITASMRRAAQLAQFVVEGIESGKLRPEDALVALNQIEDHAGLAIMAAEWDLP